MTNLMDFPDEILQAIADMVDPVSRLRLWRVNRRFRNITKMDKASSRKYWKRVELNGRIRRLNSFERAEIEFMRGMSIIEYVNDAYPYSGGYGGYNHRQKNLVLKSIRRFPEELTAYVKEKATPDFIEWLRDSLTCSSPDSLISLKEVHDETYDIIDMLKSTRVYEDLEEAYRLEVFLLKDAWLFYCAYVEDKCRYDDELIQFCMSCRDERTIVEAIAFAITGEIPKY